MVNRLSRYTLLASFILVLALAGCKKDSDTQAPSNGGTGPQSGKVVKIFQKTLQLDVDSKLLSIYPLVLINQIINNIYANPKAYTITRTDGFIKTLKVNSAKFVDRTRYNIVTEEIIEPGSYRLVLVNPSDGKTQVEENFTVNVGDGGGEGIVGNYSDFTPVKTKYPDGVILSIIDAEIGSPSFYNVKFSLPASLANNNNTVKNAIRSTGSHSISPAVTNGVREAIITGYNPADLIVTETGGGITRNLRPKFDSYTEQIDGETYTSTEYLVYLNSLPIKDQVYSITLQTSNVGASSYKSAQFKFRFAFSETNLVAFTSIKAKNICFVTTATGQVKCVGENNHLATGYDAGSYTESNPYQLSFLTGLSEVSSIAITPFTTCAIRKFNAQRQTSETVCWGSNAKGLLGLNDARTDELSFSDNYGSASAIANAQFYAIDSSKAREVAPPIGETGLNARTIISGTNDFCAITVSNFLYCWGPFSVTYAAVAANQRIPTKQDIKFSYAGNPAVSPDTVHSFALGNQPTFCIVGNYNIPQLGNGNKMLCQSGSTLSQVMNPPNGTLKFAKASPGEGFQCTTFSMLDGSFPQQNIYCKGENGSGQLGVTGDSATSSFAIPYLLDKSKGTIDAARDIISGPKFMCYISDGRGDESQDGKFRCAGGTNDSISTPLTGNSSDKDISNRPYFNFGSDTLGNRVKAVSASAGQDLICTSLNYKLYGKNYYAVKCWGAYQLSNSKYYSTGSTPNETSFNHIPVIRW